MTYNYCKQFKFIDLQHNIWYHIWFASFSHVIPNYSYENEKLFQIEEDFRQMLCLFPKNKTFPAEHPSDFHSSTIW